MPKKRAQKLIVFSHSPNIGGAELALLDMLDFFYAQGIAKPHFIIPAQAELTDRLKHRGWTYDVVPYSVWAWPVVPKETEDKFRETIKNLRAIELSQAIIRKVKPDMVITNTVVAPWGALAAATLGVPHAWYVHEYGDIDHGLNFELGTQKTFSDIGMLSDIVVANSLAIEEHIAQFIDRSKIQTTYIPYDVDAFLRRSNEAAETVFSSKADIRLVLLGRITPSKGQMTAVEAVAKLKRRGIRAELCIVGSGDDLEYVAAIQRLVDTHDLKEHVVLKNHVENPLPIIKQADIGLTCSKIEAFGRTTFEYMLLDKAVIATKAGGSKELVKDGFNGQLYEFGDAAALATIIGVYVENTKELREHGANAKEQVKEILHGQHNAVLLLQRLGTISNTADIKPKIPYIFNQFVGFAETAVAFKDIVEQNGLQKLRRAEHELNTVEQSRTVRFARIIIRPVIMSRRLIRKAYHVSKTQ